MRALHDKKKVLFAFVVVASLIFCVFMLLATTNTIANVSAVEANGVGVYWDSDCSDGVSSIDWGTLEPGSAKNITVYIRNEREEPILLIRSTTNWDPSKASEYITLTWNCTGRRIDPNEVIQITLTLSVSRYIEGISSFSFDITVTGSDRLLGDVNGDGRVSAADMVLWGLALFSYPGDPNYNPYADVNQDGRISAADIVIIGKHLGESWL